MDYPSSLPESSVKEGKEGNPPSVGPKKKIIAVQFIFDFFPLDIGDEPYQVVHLLTFFLCSPDCVDESHDD